jgi:hypothetical protein
MRIAHQHLGVFVARSYTPSKQQYDLAEILTMGEPAWLLSGLLGFTRIVIEIRAQTAIIREGNHKIAEHLNGMSHIITENYTKLEMRDQPKQE